MLGYAPDVSPMMRDHTPARASACCQSWASVSPLVIPILTSGIVGPRLEVIARKKRKARKGPTMIALKMKKPKVAPGG